MAWTGPGSTAPNGNVAAPINVSSSAQTKSGPLQVNGLRNYTGTTVLDGNVSIGTTSISEKLSVSGNVKATAFLYSSDAALKHDIRTITNATALIKQLRGVSFKWNEDNRASVGLIAQEVEQVLPEIVHTDSATNLKSIEYANLVAPLIEAVKEQQSEIESLKRQMNELQAEINALR